MIFWYVVQLGINLPLLLLSTIILVLVFYSKLFLKL